MVWGMILVNGWRSILAQKHIVDGVITTLDLSSIPLADAYVAAIDETIVQRLERVNQPAVTLLGSAQMPMVMKCGRPSTAGDPDLKLASLNAQVWRSLRLWWIWMVMVFLNSSWQMVLGASTS